MATFTTRLGLRKPAGTDLVTVTTDINASMDSLDTAIDRICTSSTRPSTPFVGLRAYETDTGRFIICVQVTPSVLWGYYNPLSGTSGTRPVVAGTQGLFNGTLYKETDTHNLLSYVGGSGWEHTTLPVVSNLNQVVAPYNNMLVLLSTDMCVYRYQSAGGLWKVVVPTANSIGKWRSTGQTVNGNTLAQYATVDQTCPNFVTVSGTNNTTFTLLYAGWYEVIASNRFSTGNPGHEIHICEGTPPFNDVFSKWRAQGSGAPTGGTAVLKKYFNANAVVFVNLFGAVSTGLTTTGETNHLSIEYLGKQI